MIVIARFVDGTIRDWNRLTGLEVIERKDFSTDINLYCYARYVRCLREVTDLTSEKTTR